MKNAHEVAVVCFSEGHHDVVEYVAGVKVFRVATRMKISKQALSLSYFPMLSRAIKEFKPEVIHLHWANPYPAAVLLTMMPKDLKLVIHWHMDIIAQSNIYPFIKPVETALLRRASLILVTSPNYRDASAPLQPFIDKVKVLPNAVDKENLKQRDGDEERIEGIKAKYGNKKMVLFIGRHTQYKGLPYLLEAEGEVKSDCVFVIGGEGSMTKELNAKCKSQRVHSVGRLTDEELRLYFHAASVFAFPSFTKNEAFGMALAEAMYCRTPAVTFTIPGSGVNWVCPNGECGIEVPNGNVEEYAKAIDRLLSDEKLAHSMGETGHKRVKELFTVPTMIKRLNEYYSEMMEEGSMPHLH